jgi:hypothetical protein
MIIHGMPVVRNPINSFNILNILNLVRFEVFAPVTMKNTVFCDIAPSVSCALFLGR